MMADKSRIWSEYLEEVLHLPLEAIRPESEPRIFDQGKRTDNVIVLIHGLSDSPFYMRAIAQRFYDLGFNVIIPLLPAHALKDAVIAQKRMETVKLDEWQKAVRYAVNLAKTRGNKVSIGGLSLGGVLSLYQALNYPQDINGAIFLFAAAIDLGDFRETLLRSQWKFTQVIKDMADELQEMKQGSIIVDNPYTYAWIPTESIQELVALIREIEKNYPDPDTKYDDLTQPVFVAHSEFDEAVDIKSLEQLINNHPEKHEKTYLFRIREMFYLTHPRIVLENNVYSLGKKIPKGEPVQSKNPFFDDMMEAVRKFVSQHLSPL